MDDRYHSPDSSHQFVGICCYLDVGHHRVDAFDRQRRGCRLQSLPQWKPALITHRPVVLRHRTFAVNNLQLHGVCIRCGGEQFRAVESAVRGDDCWVARRDPAECSDRAHLIRGDIDQCDNFMDALDGQCRRDGLQGVSQRIPGRITDQSVVPRHRTFAVHDLQLHGIGV